MQIASWNVNSIKARLPNVLAWLKEAGPDIVCLQELKCVDEAFPRAEIEALGYNFAVFGQKTYNGVALLSKHPLEDITRGLPNFEDEQSRYIEAVISTDTMILRVASIYLPNGNPMIEADGKADDSSSAKYTYKLAFMAALKAHAASLLDYEEILVLAGDYNVIPRPCDVYDPSAWEDDALYHPETRAAFRAVKNLGLSDAVEMRAELEDISGEDIYTFWDYQGGAWSKNKGVRIDHHLLSPQAVDRLKSFRIDTHTRSWERPSDHVPVSIELD